MTKILSITQRLLSLICLCLYLSANSYAEVPENQVKATFLIWFGELTNWPEERAAEPEFVICLSNDSDLKAPLEEVKDHLIKNKPLKIQYDVSADKVNTCHILYVDQNNHKVFNHLQQSISSVLTVSSEEGFVKTGVIEFYRTSDDRIKMRGNLGVMTKSKLLISSKLLRLMDTTD